MKKPTWRLRKTLARRIETRPIEDADVRYAWAAYKTGALTIIEPGLSAEQFKPAFEQLVGTRYPVTWVILVQTAKGFIPAGIVFAASAPLGAYLIIMGVVWCPWATKRNILEGTVAFFNRLRRETPWMGYATEEHRKVYEVCCMHGIMRRIGKSQEVYPGATIFEGRK